jgi:hypothetical protein
MRKILIIKLVTFATVFLLSITAMVGAEELVLKLTKTPATVDGLVTPGEYSFSYEYKQIKLDLSKTRDSLYVAVTAQTSGWVAVGFNSMVMNNADILIGYMKDGDALLVEQRGSGHRHSEKALGYVKSFAMNESGRQTTLEVECDVTKVIRGEKDNLEIILAYGGNDSPKSYHKLRTSVSIKVID